MEKEPKFSWISYLNLAEEMLILCGCYNASIFKGECDEDKAIREIAMRLKEIMGD